MIKVSQDRQPGLGTTGIVGALTLTKTGTTARTATFPDAAITVAGSASALTSGRVPFVTTGGLLADNAALTWSGSTLSVTGSLSAIASSAGNLITALQNTRAGAGASTQLVLRSDLGDTAAISLAQRSSTSSATIFGAVGAFGDFLVFGASSAGIRLGCFGVNAPIIFGINTSEVFRMTSSMLTSARPLTVSNTTASTSTVTGALVVAGGVGVAGAGYFGGTLTVPNGTAAAPGIRLTSEASGLYRLAGPAVGVSAGGVAAIAVGALASGTSHSYILMYSADATLPTWITNQTTADAMVIGGSSAGMSSGGQLRLYGATHATKASLVEFTRGATVSAYFDGSGILTVNSTTDATTTSDGSVRLSGGLSVVKSLVTGNARKIGVRSVTSAAGTTTLDGTDHCAVCTGSTTQTFTLPAAAAGRILFIKNRSTGNLTVNRAGADTIDGTTTVVLTAGQSLQIVANGTDWVVL